MNENKGHYDLRRRTMDYALRILRLCAKLPNTPEAQAIRRQLIKSGTSPGAHYREACRARSTAEFKSKMNGGLQELDESAYWLELLIYSKIHDTSETHDLARETEELTRIFVTCIRNAKDSD
jgi:four helix bundle protein